MAAEWRSSLGAFLGATERAIQAGLIAAAEAAVTDQKDLLTHGYTSGDFVTGVNVNAVARGEPEQTADGWQIAYGSRQTDPPYPLYWELGHVNLFMRRYVRVESWVPNMISNRHKYVGIMTKEIQAVDGAL